MTAVTWSGGEEHWTKKGDVPLRKFLADADTWTVK